MRAQFIYENIEFERGIEPRKAMKIGMMERILQEMENDDTWVWNYDLNDCLQWACREGKIDYIKYLLNEGADIGGNEEITIHWAVINGHLDVVKMLIDAGADINHRVTAGHRSFLLQVAIETNQKDIVKFLIKKGAIVNAKVIELAKKHNMENILDES